MAFKLKSQAAVSEGGFKMMGSSPLTMRGHEPELPKGHIHPGGDDTKWEVKDEIKNDDGSITVETRSGQTGSEGKPASTKTITTPVPTDPIPTAEGGVQTEDPDAYIESLQERFPNASRQDMIDQGYISPHWDGDWTDPEIETTTEVVDIPAEDPVEATEKTEELTMNPEQHWREVGTKHGDIYQKRPILDFFKNLKSKFGKGRTSGGKSCGPNDKGPGCEAYD